LLFVCVGATCFLAQYGTLTVLGAVGVYRPLANAVGFLLSAQLNFALSSRLTWRDRPAGTARALWVRLISYNGTALLSLAVNTGVFAVTYHRVGNLMAAALGVGCGMCVTYLVCDLLIFRDRRRRPAALRVTRWVRASHTPAHRAHARRSPISLAPANPVPTRPVSATGPAERDGTIRQAQGKHRIAASAWERS
jgi:putative flippase GtrA